VHGGIGRIVGDEVRLAHMQNLYAGNSRMGCGEMEGPVFADGEVGGYWRMEKGPGALIPGMHGGVQSVQYDYNGKCFGKKGGWGWFGVGGNGKTLSPCPCTEAGGMGPTHKGGWRPYAGKCVMFKNVGGRESSVWGGISPSWRFKIGFQTIFEFLI